MASLKKILALVLVVAMTFTMLPVFAAADDVAVETVAPVAEAPAAEAAPAAVEDVAVVPAEAPAAIPAEAVTAIETVAAETVAPVAELQELTSGNAEFENDDVAIENGYFLRLDVPGVGSAYYNGFQAASNDYCNNAKAGSVLYLLCDYTVYSETDTTSGIINCSAKDGNTTLNNLTFDLNGKTLTARLKRPVFARGGNSILQIHMQNGTIIYQNLGSESRRAIAYSNNAYPTNNAGSSFMSTSVFLTDMTCICVEPLNGGYAPAVISSNLWTNGFHITNCTLVSMANSAIELPLVNKWSSSTGATQIAYAAQARRNVTINLEGDCVIGSTAGAAAIRYNYPSTVTDNSLFVGLTIDPGPAKKTVFLGTDIVDVVGDPDDADRLLKTLPEGYTETATVALPLPDASTFFDESSAAEDVQPGWTEPAEFTAIAALACDHAAKEHHDLVPATYTSTGTAEHYYCPTCEQFLEADGVTETTEEALTIPMLECPHAGLVHHDEVPGTFSTPGVQACWYCNDCEKYFTDEYGENETTLEALSTLPKRDLSDIEGLTDDDMSALGALVRTKAPDGTVTVFMEITPAIELAATWTEPGGEVKLLQDYAVKSNAKANTDLLWDIGENSAHYHTDSDPLVGTLYGFWIDLGGHTLSVWRPSSLFGHTPEPTSVNVKNGRLIHLNADTDVSHSAGIAKAAIHVGGLGSVPYDTETHEMLTGRVTLYNADVIAFPGGTVSNAIFQSFWDCEIRLYNSKAIGGTYAISLAKAENTIPDEIALQNIQAHGFTNNIYLYGNSVLGSMNNNRQITFRTWTQASGNKADETTSPAEDIEHSVNVHADPEARFFGSTGGFVSDGSGKTFELHQNGPEGFDKVVSTAEYTLPSKTSLTTLAATTVGFVPEDDAPSTRNVYYFEQHVHAPTYHEATAATELAPGNTEYWSCTCGKFFADEACTTEIEENSWVIPQLVCDHGAKALLGEVPATYSTEGRAECWYCETCGTYWEADGETETTLDALTIPMLDPASASAQSDDQMVEMGAVAKTVAPDGTVKAFTTPNKAYLEAATWTQPGGVVYMLCDYTHYDTTKGPATGIINSGATSTSTNQSWTYANADDPSLKGFWFDLNGYTIVIRSGGAAFYNATSLPVNMRNGRLIYQNMGGTAASYPALKSGYTSTRFWTSESVYCPEWTLKDMTVIRVPHGPEVSAGPIFFLSTLQSKINIIDSTVICNDGGYGVFYQTATTDNHTAADDYAATQPYAHELNLSGNTVFGTTSPSKEIIYSRYGTTAVDCPTKTITVNVDGDNVRFLGTTFLTRENENVTVNLPEGYYSPSTKFSYTLIDASGFADETGAGANVLEQATPTEMTQWVRSVDQSGATFTPEGGAESAQTTLTEAFAAWIASGYKGTIKLQKNLSVEDATATRFAIGEAGTSYTTDTEAQPYEPVYLIPEAAAGGSLTFDLNGYNAELDCGLFGMDDALTDFDLTVQNGAVTTTAGRPIVVLKGAGGCFKLVNATFACTEEKTSTNPITDARYGGAYAILMNSTVSSVYRGAIALYTTSVNSLDGTLLYYIKDCELATTGGDKQPTINSLSTLGSTYRPYAIILDGTTVLRNDKFPETVNLHNGELHYLAETTYGTDGNSLYTLTVGGESKLTAIAPEATVTFGDVLTLYFKTLPDAAEFAELFGRNGSKDVALSLNKDAVVTESKEIGQAGCASAFTFALNGNTVSGKAPIAPAGGAGTQVTITMADAGTAKLIAGAPEKTFAANDKIVIEKGRFLTKYSLNLAENVSINIYSDGENGDPDSVGYVQGGEEYVIAAPGEEHDWVVDTLAAKQMNETVDAYAVKTSGTTTYVDFAKGVSVKGYADSDPAAYASDTATADALNATLKTMLIYGKFAEKYFAGDYSDLNADELAAVGVAAIPETDTTNLAHADRVVTGMADYTADNTATSGFYGTSAVLEDAISMKFWFFGSEFAGKTATVNGEAAALETQDAQYFVKAPISAKDFDKAITVEIAGVGSVTDSAEAYTARVGSGENEYKLVQALRAYGADAKRFAEAKSGT